jgi:hypothetical protein
MPSQIFHRITYGRVQETIVLEQLKLEKLELFNPVTQDETGFHLQRFTPKRITQNRHMRIEETDQKLWR